MSVFANINSGCGWVPTEWVIKELRGLVWTTKNEEASSALLEFKCSLNTHQIVIWNNCWAPKIIAIFFGGGRNCKNKNWYCNSGTNGSCCSIHVESQLGVIQKVLAGKLESMNSKPPLGVKDYWVTLSQSLSLNAITYYCGENRRKEACLLPWVDQIKKDVG